MAVESAVGLVVEFEYVEFVVVVAVVVGLVGLV